MESLPIRGIFKLIGLSKKMKSDYEIKILVIYKKGSESYKEVVQDYAQSLHVNTHVKATSNIELGLEDYLEKYDLIYPDVSLVDADNREDIANNLSNYVRDGGNLFLEQKLHKIFPDDVLGMSRIKEVNLKNQRFDFPIIPQKYENLQKLWKSYAAKTKPNFFYTFIRSIYHKFKGDYRKWRGSIGKTSR